jgi:uncharacterized protein (TIGR03437 family)
MHPSLQILRRLGPFLAAIFLSAITVSIAGAQCYQFAGASVKLQIDITSFTSENGPVFSNSTGYVTNDYFESNNSLTVGGVTQTSQSTANTPDCVGCLLGSVIFNYQPGSNSVTDFTMTVPANDTPGTMDSWLLVLGGLGDVIPSGVLPLPGAFPPISHWALPSNEDTLTVTSSSGTNVYPITSVGPCSGAAGSTPAIGAVVSASDFGGFSSVAPGSWVEIYGTNLAPGTGSWSGSDFNGNTAPTSLDSVSVSVGGQAAFVNYISAAQVNAQLPSNIATGGPLQLTVTNGSATSAPVNITVNATQPGLLAPASFKIGGDQYLVAFLPDGTYVLPTGSIAGINSRPAHPGETITTYGVGFGSVTPDIAAGQIATQQNQLALPFQILFGQTPAQLTYFGLAPNYVGLYQFDVVVPAVPDSNLVPLTFSLADTPGTQTLFTAVQQ